MIPTPLLPYRDYKSSGIEWLGDVPAHWGVPRLKQVCSRYGLYGANVPADNYQETGVRFLRTTDITDGGTLRGSGVFLPSELVRGYMLNDGDILISRSGTVGRSFLYQSNLHGLCSYAGYLVRFVPNSSILPNYLFFFTKTVEFADFLKASVISSTIENVNADKYAKAHLPLPPYAEQTAIVRYLEHADSRVRRYVNAKERLIELLTEQRQAVINQAVTRGLDPNVRLKPSDVEWLGDVPTHWRITRLKALLTEPMQNGLFKRKEHFGLGVPLINVADVYREDFRVDPESLERVQVSSDEARRFCVRNGDIFFVRSSLKLEGTGRSAIAVNCSPDTVFECHLVRAATESTGVNTRFLVTQLNSPVLRDYLISRTNVVTMATIAQGTFASSPVLIPPRSEQDRIIAWIDTQWDQITLAIEHTKREIELMYEYRTRLIADLVTGKLDVRNAMDGLDQVADLVTAGSPQLELDMGG